VGNGAKRDPLNRHIDQGDDPDLDQESKWHVPPWVFELAGCCCGVFEARKSEEQQKGCLAETADDEWLLAGGHRSGDREDADRHEDREGQELGQHQQDRGVDAGAHANDVDGSQNDQRQDYGDGAPRTIGCCRYQVAESEGETDRQGCHRRDAGEPHHPTDLESDEGPERLTLTRIQVGASGLVKMTRCLGEAEHDQQDR